MALSFANLTSGGTSADSTSFNTASVTPGSNRLVLLAVNAYIAIGSTQPPNPTVTGNGLTWVQVNKVDFDTTGTDRSTVFLYRAMGASPSAGAITIDFGAQNIGSCSWVVSHVDGCDTSGTNGSGAVVQSVTNTVSNGTTITATLAAFSDGNNAGYGTFGHQTSEGKTPGSGWTELADALVSVCSLQAQYQLATDTTCDASWVTSGRAGVVAIEVKVATGPTTHQITATGSGTTGGSAELRMTAQVTASGSGTTGGSAALGVKTPMSASGSGSTAGSAAINIVVVYLVTSTGSGTTGGSAAITIRTPLPITATGTGTTDGSAAIGTRLAMTASGSGATSGGAAFRVVNAISASGSGVTGGSVAIDLDTAGDVLLMTASGSSITAGAAAPQVILARYRFIPPTHEEPIRGFDHVKPLAFYRLTYAETVYRSGGTFVSMRTPSAEDLAAAGDHGTDYFIGGHEYDISASVRNDLVAAGYTVTVLES